MGDHTMSTTTIKIANELLINALRAIDARVTTGGRK